MGFRVLLPIIIVLKVILTTKYRYFHSWFHCFDALVITAAFVLDVVLRGVTEEAASLIVVLRLWRVFKIIEELSVGAQEQVEELQVRIEDLEKGNRELEAKIQQFENEQRNR
jgi:membrane protein implicated in regulation of membrane protease activity